MANQILALIGALTLFFVAMGAGISLLVLSAQGWIAVGRKIKRMIQHD